MASSVANHIPSLLNLFNSTFPQLSSLDFGTETKDSGDSYSQYKLSNFPMSVNEAYMEVGKYIGDSTFIFKFYDLTDQPLRIEFDDAESIVENDSIIEQIYAGLKINELESQPSSSLTYNIISELSFDFDVLSTATAFLALEPDVFGNDVCKTCVDETDPITPVNNIEDENSITFYPNPFFNSLMIDIGEVLEEVTIEVYSITGKLVFVYTISTSQELEMSALRPGVYVVVVKDKDDEVLQRVEVFKGE